MYGTYRFTQPITSRHIGASIAACNSTGNLTVGNRGSTSIAILECYSQIGRCISVHVLPRHSNCQMTLT